MSQHRSRRRSASRRLIARWMAVFAGTSGLILILGFPLGFGVPMPPWSCVAFAACGAALLFVNRRVSLLASAAVLLIGTVATVEHTFAITTAFDRLLFSDHLSSSARFPGRPAPLPSLHFVLLGSSLLLLRARRRPLVVIREAAALFVATLCFRVLTSNVLAGGDGGVRMAPLNAVLSLAVTAGVIAAGRRSLIVPLLRDRGPAGTIARRLLPVPLLLPAITSAIQKLISKTGTLDAGAGAVVAAMNILAAVAIVWFCAASLLKMDRSRRDAESALRASRDGLRDAVTARTEELEESRNWLRITLSSIADGVVATDTTGRLIFLNPVAERWTRWSAEEACGRSIHDVVILRNGDTPIALPADAFTSPWASSDDCSLVGRDGSVTAVTASALPMLEPNGTIAGAVFTFRDVTALRENERLLRAREAEARTLLEALPDVVCRFDRELRFTYISPAVEGLTTFPPAHFIGKTHVEAGIAEPLAGQLRASLTKIFETGQPDTLDFDFPSPELGTRHLVGRVVPELGPDGAVQSVLSLIRDVTDQKRGELALRESEERQRLAANAGKIGLWDWDIENNRVIWSERVYEFHGVPPGGFDGTLEGFGKLIHPADSALVAEALRKSLELDAAYDLEFRAVRPSGEVRWLKTNARVIRDTAGRPVRMLGAVLDTTESREAEEALRRTNAELEEFAYAASHDLQEPLRNVNIYTELLLRRHIAADNEDARLFAEFIRSGVSRMRQLIHDLLSYSRTVHSEVMTAKRADLRRAFGDAVAVVDGRVAQMGGMIECGDLPTVMGDETQLGQVFQNLLANSLKYAHPERPPCIRISASATGDEWVIAVRDNGIGFDPKYNEHIFGLFKRLHKDEYPGTGLGLAICRRLVERCGGRMWAEGRPGEGASFYFALSAAHETGRPDAAGASS